MDRETIAARRSRKSTRDRARCAVLRSIRPVIAPAVAALALAACSIGTTTSPPP